MAFRYVYETSGMPPYVREVGTSFDYYGGFSLAQKQRCIRSLHEAYLAEHGDKRVLEVSSRSESRLGVALSAFNLTIQTSMRAISVESAFQASKVFENGGPYKDLLDASARDAKRDERLRTSGNVIGFEYFGREFPTTPKDYFYTWLYVNALVTHEDLASEVLAFDSFTDIEFNPKRQFNCQAIAVARYVSLARSGLLESALADEASFLSIVYGVLFV